VGTVGRLLTAIVLLTLTAEGLGALLLFASWGPGLPGDGFERVFFSVFHAVSAFCNAGFSLLSDGFADPLVAETPVVLLPVAALIIIGGLGFLPLTNLLATAGRLVLRRRRPPVQLRVQTRLVLVTTAALLLGGTLLVFLLERGHALAGLPAGEQLLHSAFLAVTARTAGFHTIPVAALLAPTTLLLMVFMFIGASPGSTGGGVKTTTFALAVLSARAMMQDRARVEVYHRTIAWESILRAFVIICGGLGVTAAGTLLITLTDDVAFLDAAFEVVSAFATVGLSRGVTPGLSDAGKLVLCACMIAGRVGIITIALAVVPQRTRAEFEYPAEQVITT
jgi:Trk-type K+ transport system membrane component